MHPTSLSQPYEVSIAVFGSMSRRVGTGFGPMAWVAYGPHWPRLPPPASPAPMLRSRASPGSNARHWSPDVILGFAEYALSFPIYIRLSFSLSLLFRQSLLYDSQFNISIRTRLISTTLKTHNFGHEVPTKFLFRDGCDRQNI